MAHWDEVDEPARTTGIARDVILVHLASMSNLFAASGWMLGQLVLHPDVSRGYETAKPGCSNGARSSRRGSGSAR